MEAVDNHIIAQCVKVGKSLKLRILTANIPINQQLYCSGNREIRQEGAVYKVKVKGQLKLVQSATPFYKLSNNKDDYIIINHQIKQITTQDLHDMGIQVFSIPICCICLDNPSNIFLQQCRHQILCQQCFDQLKTPKQCPMCRAAVLGHQLVID